MPLQALPQALSDCLDIMQKQVIYEETFTVSCVKRMAMLQRNILFSALSGLSYR